MPYKLKLAGAALVSAIAISAATPAQAITVEFVSITPATGGFNWTYDAFVTSSEIVDVSANPSFFTVFDFGPNTLLGGAPPFLTYSTTLTSTAAFGTSPTDDPSILNVNFTVNPGTPIITGPFTLGAFTLFSTNGPSSHNVFFDGQGTNNNAAFTPLSDVGLVAAPISVTATPLPAALPLFATGLGAIGLLGWCRKRKAQAVA